MRDKDDLGGAMLKQILDGGEAGANPKIAGHRLGFAVIVRSERDVVIGAHQDDAVFDV